MAEFVLADRSVYEPFDKQCEFHASTKRFKVASAGNRGGKTLCGAAEFLWSIGRDLAAGKGKRAVGIGPNRVPRLLYWVVAPTHDMAQWPYQAIISLLPHELITYRNDQTRTLWLVGNVKIEFKTGEHPQRLAGASVNGVWVDECARVRAEAWRGQLRARIADQQGWAIFTTSPLGGRASWAYQDLVSKQGIDEHVAAFSWTTADNPYFPQHEYEHAKANTNAAWFKRDWEANWDAFGGAIYDEFRDELHVCTEREFRIEHGLRDDRPLREFFSKAVCTIDWGFVAAGCLLVVGEYGEGKWLVLDESYGPGRRPANGTSVTWLGEYRRLASKWGFRELIADPEDAGACFDMRNAGVSVRAASKEVYTGIRRVASAMHPNPNTGKPGLRILSHCKNLIAEARNYMWKPTKDLSGFLEEPAEGQQDHALDCLRYAAMELRLYDYVEQQRRGIASPIA